MGKKSRRGLTSALFFSLLVGGYRLAVINRTLLTSKMAMRLSALLTFGLCYKPLTSPRFFLKISSLSPTFRIVCLLILSIMPSVFCCITCCVVSSLYTCLSLYTFPLVLPVIPENKADCSVSETT